MPRGSRVSLASPTIRRLVAGFADDYRTRIMLTSCFSLILVILVLHVPLQQFSPRIGWLSTFHHERVELRATEITAATEAGQFDAVPVTDFGSQPDELPVADVEERAAEDAPATLPEATKVTGRDVLNFVEQQPKIVGGIGSYYLKIDYPEAARAAGIEGRLVLSFVVEPSGRASDIRVEQSLHPLCDSAAVAALQKSLFIAGRQDGKTVPVRMRLPVQFRLIEIPEEPILSQSRAQ